MVAAITPSARSHRAAIVQAADAATPRVLKREASARDWAWRHNYYAFRHARTRIEADRPADAVPYIVGEFAPYVRSRLAELAQADQRYARALALADGNAAPEVPAAIVAPPASPGVIVNRKAFAAALRGLVAAIPTNNTRTATTRDGQEVSNPGKLVRLIASGVTLQVAAANYRDIAPVAVAGVQVGEPFDVVLLPDVLTRIADLSPDDALTLRAEGGDLIVTGADARYRLHTLSPTAAMDLVTPLPTFIELGDWLDKACALSAGLSPLPGDSGDALREALATLLRQGGPARRKKFGWRLLRATEERDPAAAAARAALLAADGPTAFRRWLDEKLGVDPNAVA